VKTFSAKSYEVEREWFVVDAEGQTLGRLATFVATLLRGKHKPVYTPHVDCGDYVIVVNADKINVTGKKLDQKIYYRHSGYPGGLKEETAVKVRAKRPIRLVEEAVSGMLPKTKLGKQMYRKLKVYAGDKHPHQAQKPEAVQAAGR